jgi:TonB dependent receptor/CarboxypepD_reg-like domain/TonB-dependent Receptor Plug Domain
MIIQTKIHSTIYKNHFLWLLFLSTVCVGQSVTVSGYVREVGSLESIVGASVYLEGNPTGTTTNRYGFYSLAVPLGQSATVVFSFVGYERIKQRIDATTGRTLTVLLKPQSQALEEVKITDQATDIAPTQLGLIKLSVQQIKQIPAILGEKDVIKALQLLPGVQKGTEGSTALYVRGGGPDQNLILLDEAQVYNANHLFGFLSVFNGDAIKNIDFYKGGFPARYGGRLSSVIDLQMKDGNKETLHGEGGIGLLSSKLMLEGPLQKNKSSFLVSGRRTYFDLFTTPLMDKEFKLRYYFYDFNAKVNFDLGTKDKIYLSGYFGNDRLKTTEELTRSASTIYSNTTLGWGNATATARWNHQYTEKLFLNTTALFTNFDFGFDYDFKRVYNDATITTNKSYVGYSSAIRDYSIKADFDYFPSPKHSVKFGGLFTFHRFKPRSFIYESQAANSYKDTTQRFGNQEFALYIEDTYGISNRLSVNVGLRLSGLHTAAKTYVFGEPRLSVGYRLSDHSTLKASYGRNNQFVHLLSNTGIGLSTDLWVPATSKAPPQQADQVAVGLSRSFVKAGLEVTVESFRKNMRNIVSYKEGAAFLSLNDGVQDINWENNITTGRGWAYGTEVLLQKNKGKLTGWLGYTLSWTIQQFNELNGGKRFYPRYDRRHDFSAVAIYRPSPKVTFSANWVYATGNAMTIPQGYYFGVSGIGSTYTDRIDYLGSRNSFRAAAYHRLDVAVQLHKKKRWGERTWEFGLFNAYNRQNPLYYYIKTENSPAGLRTSLAKKGMFPVVPSISYNFKF